MGGGGGCVLVFERSTSTAFFWRAPRSTLVRFVELGLVGWRVETEVSDVGASREGRELIVLYSPNWAIVNGRHRFCCVNEKSMGFSVGDGPNRHGLAVEGPVHCHR